MRFINTIVVHCSDTETGDVDSFRRFHQNTRGWKDVGYHYVITRAGEIQKGRPIEEIGAHVSGANAHSIGICLVGKEDFEEVQFEALRKLVKDLKDQIGKLQVIPHNSLPSAKAQRKTCPNFDVKKVLDGN